ncbi:MAG TPA: SOS response-associated peptidase [Phycisphaerales bacterium]|nr:SOS response-associated peptidase [Phycisphaerales bacterium]
MCGRFVARYSPEVMRRLFPELEGNPYATLKERWNAAPTQSLGIIRPVAAAANATTAPSDLSHPVPLELVEATWGLIPSWSKEENPKPGPINARCETVATNGLFRVPFRSRRCIVPASGFYEWQERMLAPKRPLYITRADDEPLLMAGLYEPHRGRDSFTIVTVAAGDSTRDIHDRTPAVLEPGDEARAWLNPATQPETLAGLFHPVRDGLLQWHPVSTRVNNPRNEGPELIQRTEE